MTTAEQEFLNIFDRKLDALCQSHTRLTGLIEHEIGLREERCRGHDVRAANIEKILVREIKPAIKTIQLAGARHQGELRGRGQVAEWLLRGTEIVKALAWLALFFGAAATGTNQLAAMAHVVK